MSRTKRSEFIYTPLFCEENIWHLADALIQQGVSHSDLHVIFIINENQKVAIFNQRSGCDNTPVVWDYHVILLRETATQPLVYDFDATTQFITPARHYIELSFPGNKRIPPPYQAQFRFINALTYLNQFSSDRSHMLGIIDTNKFPDYPAIHAKENHPPIFLEQFIDINSALPVDETLLSLDQFKARVL